MSCYFPNGVLSPSDLPCVSSATSSHCCRPNDVCLDNGYCFGASNDSPNVISRASCTDSTFASAACPQICKDVNPSGAAVLRIFGGASPALYCCGSYNTSNGQCHDTTFTSNLPFVLPNGNFITNRTDGTTWPLNLTQPAKTVPATFVTVTANASMDAASRDQPSNMTIGMSVGVPLGVLLLAALAVIFLERRQYRRAERMWQQERQGVLDRFSLRDMKAPHYSYRNDASVHELHISRPLNVHELSGGRSAAF